MHAWAPGCGVGMELIKLPQSRVKSSRWQASHLTPGWKVQALPTLWGLTLLSSR